MGMGMEWYNSEMGMRLLHGNGREWEYLYRPTVLCLVVWPTDKRLKLCSKLCLTVCLKLLPWSVQFVQFIITTVVWITIYEMREFLWDKNLVETRMKTSKRWEWELLEREWDGMGIKNPLMQFSIIYRAYSLWNMKQTSSKNDGLFSAVIVKASTLAYNAHTERNGSTRLNSGKDPLPHQ